MRKISIMVTAAAALLVALPPATVDATPPSGVNFVVPTTIPGDGPTFGSFTATGAAVDDGIMCPFGDTIDVFGRVTAFQSQTGVSIQVVKQFTCDDGSGDFLVKLQVRIDRRGDNFRWNVLSGTGDYEHLHGTGSGVGLYGDGSFVLDIYDGNLHID